MSIDHIENGDFSNTTSAERGVCYSCHCKRQPGDAGIFRLGVIEYEGDLDICENCIRYGADKLGWISPQRASQLEGMIAALESDEKLAKTLIKEQDKALKALGYVGDVRNQTRKRTRAKA